MQQDLNKKDFVSPLSTLQTKYGWTFGKAKSITDIKGKDIKGQFCQTIKHKFWGESLPMKLLIHAAVSAIQFCVAYAIFVWLIGADAPTIITIWIVMSFLDTTSAIKDAWGNAFFQTMLIYAPDGVVLSGEDVKTSIKGGDAPKGDL